MTTKTCPYCLSPCPVPYIDVDADWTYEALCECEKCGTLEIDQDELDDKKLTYEEINTGWYKPK